MNKKIELELSHEIYETLKKSAKRRGMTVDDYIEYLLKEGLAKDQLRENNLIQYKDYIIKELETLLKKVKGLSNSDDNPQNSKVLIYSYKMYKHSLPKDIDQIIQHYKIRGWFNEDYFYFILDKKGIVGYMGLSLENEELPFGEYFFVYSLHLSKKYHNSQNTKYIAGFLQAIAKKSSCHSIDIASTLTNIDSKILEEMGFIKFDRAQIIKGVTKNKEYEVMKCNQQKIKLEEVIDKNYINSGRSVPIRFLYRQWLEKEEEVDFTLYNMLRNGKELEYIVVSEKINKGKDGYTKYTVLVEPTLLFDEVSLKSIYLTKMNNVMTNEKRGKVQISMPDELLEIGELMTEDTTTEVTWYRKLVMHN
ncbi:hypothetical protein [Alkaliphilus transvaalensis]|uniref:hypothetical protein n=1 Tax=Alkaliphilus transvaalensis TaxID=114628 RepID=UPI00047DF3E8|nr:hypothetical protein [Alkaliphilus transvaalensis]